MISMEELLNKKYKLVDQSPEIQANLKILLDKINQVRQAYGKPMSITSGLRTMDDHLRIYKEKAKKEGKVFDEKKVPMKSKHLYGQSVDVADPKGVLQSWCKQNEPLLKKIGLWLESFDYCKGWVHFQIVPYGSYKEGKSIWFIP